MTPSPATSAIRDRSATAMNGTCSLVDVSHREVDIKVRGTTTKLALSSLCAPDLEATPSGSATRTILDKVQAVLIKYAPDWHRIELWQSSPLSGCCSRP